MNGRQARLEKQGHDHEKQYGKVAILRVKPETVVEDHGTLLDTLKYQQVMGKEKDIVQSSIQHV
ncbi:MAG: hypothetical protein ACFFD4_29030, partial [Candidatus Odinarchaeota archaeon]